MSANPQSVKSRSGTISDFVVSDNHLEVSWNDRNLNYYSFSALRDWCSCAECIDRQEIDTAAMLNMPLDCAPRSVEVRDGGSALYVLWTPDDHESIYTSEWLLTNSSPRPDPSVGNSGSTIINNLPIIDYSSIKEGEKNQLALLENVRDFGFALVRGMDNEPDEVGRIAVNLGYVPGGWRYAAQPEELLVAPIRRSNNKEQTDEVDSASEAMLEACDEHYLRTMLVPHTDFSFTSWPTGLFIFHCLSPSSDGSGESILVDGFHVANRLRNEDPEAFELLSTVRQQFRGHGSIKINWRSEARIISVDDNNMVTGVRFSMSSRVPTLINSDLIVPYYRALKSMLRLVLDPGCQIQLPLSAGDCLVIDNHRILHGRTGIDPKSNGARWFRRFDVERDAAQTRMRQLAQRLDIKVASLPAGAHG